MLRVPIRALLAGLLLALWAVAPAVALSPSVSLAELQRWFDSIPNARVVMALPHEWQYAFVAHNGRALEALSQVLVRDGYRIVTLEGGPRPTLRTAKSELHSPVTLVKRNDSLTQTARRYGVAYEGWSVAL
ncbi:MAG: ribonuclease E inhibitor RraB [Gammaproteobacteria bacterium]